jgi:hypothetical protein
MNPATYGQCGVRTADWRQLVHVGNRSYFLFIYSLNLTWRFCLFFPVEEPHIDVWLIRGKRGRTVAVWTTCRCPEGDED